MQTATTTANPPASLLTETEQAWLDACPVGDARSLTFNGRTVTVDRRISWGSTPSPMLYGPRGTEIMPPIEPRWEVGLPGAPTWDAGTGVAPVRLVTITSP